MHERTHPDDPGESPHGRKRVGIAQDEEPMLMALACGRIVLDIGTGLGYSARAMAKTAALVMTVDSDPWVSDMIAPDLLQLFNVHFSSDWPPPLADQFDVVFIDGDHTVDQVQADVAAAWQRTKPWGVIVLHDAQRNRDVAMIAERWKAAVVSTTYGLGIIVRTPDAWTA